MLARVHYNGKANHPADVAELADALDSGSSKGNLVEVQVLSSAPNKTNYPARQRRDDLAVWTRPAGNCTRLPQDSPVLIITDGLCDRFITRREHAIGSWVRSFTSSIAAEIRSAPLVLS